LTKKPRLSAFRDSIDIWNTVSQEYLPVFFVFKPFLIKK
jgi:hypothetical protein